MFSLISRNAMNAPHAWSYHPLLFAGASTLRICSAVDVTVIACSGQTADVTASVVVRLPKLITAGSRTRQCCRRCSCQNYCRWSRWTAEADRGRQVTHSSMLPKVQSSKLLPAKLSAGQCYCYSWCRHWICMVKVPYVTASVLSKSQSKLSRLAHDRQWTSW